MTISLSRRGSRTNGWGDWNRSWAERKKICDPRLRGSKNGNLRSLALAGRICTPVMGLSFRDGPPNLVSAGTPRSSRKAESERSVRRIQRDLFLPFLGREGVGFVL